MTDEQPTPYTPEDHAAQVAIVTAVFVPREDPPSEEIPPTVYGAQTATERRMGLNSTARSRFHRERCDIRRQKLADIAAAFMVMRANGGKGLLYSHLNDAEEARMEWWYNPKRKNGVGGTKLSLTSPGPGWVSVEKHYVHRPSRQLAPDTPLHFKAATLESLIKRYLSPYEIEEMLKFYPRSGKFEAPNSGKDPRNRKWHRRLMRVLGTNLRALNALPHQPLWAGESPMLHDARATKSESEAAA